MSLLGAVVIGALVGVVVGALGAGGGIIAVPVLTYLLGQSEHAATNGSLVIVALTVAVALPGKALRGQVRWRDGIIFGGLTTLGAVPGRFINEFLDAGMLFVSFSVLLLTVSAIMIVRSFRGRGSENPAQPASDAMEDGVGVHRRSLLLVTGTATATGLLTGIFGVGGGFAVVPVLVLVMGFGVREATGTSLLVMLIAAGVSVATGLTRGSFEVDWLVVLLFAGGSMIGGVLAGPLSQRAQASTLSAAFGILVGIVGIFTLVRTVTDL